VGIDFAKNGYLNECTMSANKSKTEINDKDNTPTKVYMLTEFEKTMVEAGLADVTLGKVFSSEDANRILREWLNQ
jgi:hypothetical protein